MQRLHQAAFLVFMLSACHAFAAEPSTPKAALCSWSKGGSTWTLEQTIRIYYAQDEKDADYAKEMGQNAFVTMRLQDAVAAKWGKAAETAVARAICTDTLEDDEAATEQIDGDHATITLKDDTGLPALQMVRVHGEWKIDVAAYVKNLGDGVPAARQFTRQSTRILQASLRDMNDNKIKSADDLAGYLKTAFANLAAGQ